jgi:hypothetical protein
MTEICIECLVEIYSRTKKIIKESKKLKKAKLIFFSSIYIYIYILYQQIKLIQNIFVDLFLFFSQSNFFSIEILTGLILIYLYISLKR